MNDTSTRDSVRRVSRSRGFTNTTFKDIPTSALIVIHIHVVLVDVVVGFWLVCCDVSEVCCHVVVGFVEERVSVSEKGEERVVMVYEIAAGRRHHDHHHRRYHSCLSPQLFIPVNRRLFNFFDLRSSPNATPVNAENNR